MNTDKQVQSDSGKAHNKERTKRKFSAYEISIINSVYFMRLLEIQLSISKNQDLPIKLYDQIREFLPSRPSVNYKSYTHKRLLEDQPLSSAEFSKVSALAQANPDEKARLLHKLSKGVGSKSLLRTKHFKALLPELESEELWEEDPGKALLGKRQEPKWTQQSYSKQENSDSTQSFKKNNGLISVGKACCNGCEAERESLESTVIYSSSDCENCSPGLFDEGFHFLFSAQNIRKPVPRVVANLGLSQVTGGQIDEIMNDSHQKYDLFTPKAAEMFGSQEASELDLRATVLIHNMCLDYNQLSPIKSPF